MTAGRAAAVWIACGVAPWLILGSVNALGPTLDRQATVTLERRCSWSCHNRGCAHDHREPTLPHWLTADEGLFGESIRALSRGGDYATTNVVVFCVLWPGLMWALLGFGLSQRATLTRERAWLRVLREDAEGTERTQ